MTKINWNISYEDENGLFTKSGQETLKGDIYNCVVSLPKCKLVSLQWRIPIIVDENELFFSNSFLGKQPSSEHLAKTIPSSHNSYTWCYFREGSNYRLFASLDESSVGYTTFAYDALNMNLIINKDCKDYVVEGDKNLLSLFIGQGSKKDVYDQWFKNLSISPKSKDKLIGFSTECHGENISEKIIRDDLFNCRSLLRHDDYFEIGNGWQNFVGDWMEANNTKFPNGMDDLVQMIHDNGFKAGLWIAPFVASRDSALFKNHPDWFLNQSHNGNAVLNIERPEVINHLTKVFAKIVGDWGFDVIKVCEVDAISLTNKEAGTQSDWIKIAINHIKQWSNNAKIILCDVPLCSGFGEVDYVEVTDKNGITVNNANSLLQKGILNGVVFKNYTHSFSMVDPKTTQEKRDLWIKCLALLGGTWIVEDNLFAYDENTRKQFDEIRKYFDATDVRYDIENKVLSYNLGGEKKELNISALFH